MHKLKSKGLIIDKFQMLLEDDGPGDISELTNISAIEFSKSFSDIVQGAGDFMHSYSQPFEVI